MSRRYLSLRFGSKNYFALIAEESKGGLKVIEQKRVKINNENLSENGFDRDAIKSLIEGLSVQAYVVIIPPQEVITGVLEFPLTDRKKIENALKFEIESETMENPDDLIFDYRVLNSLDGRTQVAYYAINKEKIRTLLSELSAIGIDPAYLVCQQNLYSGLYKSVFDKDSLKNFKIFLDVSDNLITLTFVDSNGISFGRIFKFQSINEEKDVIKNFIFTTIQYYRIRVKKEISNIYIIADEEASDILYEILSSEIKVDSISRLNFKDSDSNEIFYEYVMQFAALNGIVELTKRQIVNFRKGEFVYKGEYDFLKKQIIKYGIASTIVILMAIALAIYKFRMLSKYEDQLNNALAEITKQILGKPYDNFTTALAVIKSKTEPKNLSIPTNSAFDYFMYFSDAFPPEVDVNIRTLEIGDKKIRMEGETDSFESVDRLVNSLKKNNCFKDITKGKVKKSPDGKRIDFDLSITPSC